MREKPFAHGRCMDVGSGGLNMSRLESSIRFIFIAFATEVVLMGPGGWLLISGAPFRKYLFVLLVGGLAVHYLLQNGKFEICDAAVWFLAAFFFILWGVFLPFLLGRNLALSFADCSPLLGLCIVPALTILYRDPAAWQNSRRCIIIALNSLALIHVIVWILGTLSDEYGLNTVATMRSILEPNVNEADSALFIGYTADGRFRVHWGPSVFLLLGLYFAVENIRKAGLRLQTAFQILLQFLAIFSTQSRGFWIAILLAGGVYFVGSIYLPQKKSMSHVCIAVLALFSLTFFLIPFYSPEFLASVGLARDGSDDIRMEQVAPLLDQLLSHPIFGFGFGGGVDMVRSDAAPYAYEVSILALYMKLGIVGVLVAYGLSCLLVEFVLRDVPFSEFNKRQIALIYAAFFGFIFAANTNPYLSNFFGMLIVTILLIELKLTAGGSFPKYNA